jgi:pimeloyl-ACP methyl ester carboxylesterase
MIAPLAKFMDWSAVQAVTLMMPADLSNPRLEEAIQFLKGPDFIPTDSQPAQVEFNGALHFTFPTPRPCELAENNVVHGRLYRFGGRWQERPVIVLLHGSGDFFGYNFRFPMMARRCNRAGFNVLTFVLPYHFQRGRPGEMHLRRMAEATAQAIAEIRALTGWILMEGCPAVALWGISLGARLAGLTACSDSRLASVVLMKPSVRFNLSFPELVLRPSTRKVLQGQRAEWAALNLTPLTLTSAQPVIPKENILLIEAIHDLLTPTEPLEELWQLWGRPDIWRLPHGHISLSLMPGLTGRILRWLEPRLNNAAAQPQNP